MSFLYQLSLLAIGVVVGVALMCLFKINKPDHDE